MTIMEKTLVIMAAGIGSRFGGLKQMAPVGPGGEFLIDYSVYDAIRAGFNKVVFIIIHDIEQDFKATIGKRVAANIETCYTFQQIEDLPKGTQTKPERTKPWGTVQAVLTCDNVINGPFAVINADDFYGKESYQVLSRFLDNVSVDNKDYCMVGFKLGNTLSKHGSVTRGLCKSGEGEKLDTIVETSGISCSGSQIHVKDAAGDMRELEEDELVSMNMWGFTPSIMESFKEEFQIFLKSYAEDLKRELVIPTAINSLIDKGNASVKVLSTPSKWFGITYPADMDEVKAKISQLIKLGEYPDYLWREDISAVAIK
jgi:dTDP-glucose pyrophosphorylase